MTLIRWTRFPALSLALAVALAGLLGLRSPGAAFAQSYPSHSVTIIVPFPAGGPLDFAARLLAEKLSASLKQPFIVENRAGVAGNMGTEAVAKATPDGHTLLMVLDTPLTAHPALYPKLPFDPERDFAPISIVASFSQMLVVHPSVPVNSLMDFVRFAKENSVTLGSGGAKGNPGYLTLESLRVQAGFDVVHVAYKGNPQVVADLVGGHVQAGFLATPSVIGLAREGKLKALAVSSPRRAPGAPNVPTVSEAGYPGFDVAFSLVMLVPAKTPASVRAVLEYEVLQALKSPDVQARLRAQEIEPIGTGGTEAENWLKTTAAKWKLVIQTAKIQLD
ncbi:Bug family tripartite tricarboxylate transporter substrate binding protein [Bradyrhizobium sp. USDA 223]|uniref:Bug family tripartite tricarboxylate transporter substrate binding protein n=1 Tax=Bradyrhizobium sp. USDA 223 TaxID=3156306 RepID=UPI003834B89E